MRKMLLTVRWPGTRMAPISSTWACRQVRWRKSGAKHRITAAKRAGRRSMAAVLWLGRPRLDQLLRHLLLQAPTSASGSPKLAKAELIEPAWAILNRAPGRMALLPARLANLSKCTQAGSIERAAEVVGWPPLWRRTRAGGMRDTRKQAERLITIRLRYCINTHLDEQ